MDTLTAKVQKSDKKPDHRADEIKKNARQIEEEIKKPENAENAPGLFMKFVNWLKSLFSKKNEPNLESSATLNGDIDASGDAVPRDEIENTLSADVTSEGITASTAVSEKEGGENMISQNSGLDEPENSEIISSVTDPTVSEAEKKAAAVNAEFEAALKGTEEPDGSVIPENTEEEATEKTEDEKSEKTEEEASGKTEEEASEKSEEEVSEKSEEETDETPSLTIGNMTFRTSENGEYVSGTVKILGKTVSWTSDSAIELKNENESYSGSGFITFTAEGLSYNEKSEITTQAMIENNKVSYMFRGGLCYERDGFKIIIGEQFEDLDAMSAEQIALLNLNIDSENIMSGQITVDSSGLKGTAEKELLWYPGAMFKGMTQAPKLVFGNVNENKLGFSLGDDVRAAVGIDNVAVLTGSDPVIVDAADGKLTYHFSEKYSLNVLSGLYEKEFTLEPLDIVMDQKLSEIRLPDIDLAIDDAELSGVSIGISVEDENKGGAFSVKSLTYKDLTIEDLAGEFKEWGIAASAGKFDFKIAGKALSGSLGGFEWRPGKRIFSVSKFTVETEDISLAENISLDSASLELSFKDGEFGFKAEGALSAEEIGTGCVTVSTKELKVVFSYGQAGEDEKKDSEDVDGQKGLSMSINGPVEVKIGSGAQVVGATIDSLSYADGEFLIETIQLNTSFDKLISDKFSGTAVLSAKNLKFSKTVELDSLNLGIDNFAYNKKTLIGKADTEIIFKEEQQSGDKSVKAEDGTKLDMGEESEEKSGILKDAKISIYLLENKKGAELTAGEVGYSFNYANVKFANIKGGFFTEGDKEFTAGTAEITTGEKLNDLLGIDGFKLAASECKISSKGVTLGTVTTDVKELVIANSLKLTELGGGLQFGEKMAFKGLNITGSATLGDITVTKLGIGILNDGDNSGAEFEAEKIEGGEKMHDLVISEVKGSFKNDGVRADSASFGIKIAGKDVTGSVKGLAWTNKDDFSVDELKVSSGEISISDDLKINSAEITAAIKNKELSIGAKAALHINEYKEGIIKIDETDLTFALDFSRKKDEKDAVTNALSGSAEGKIKITFGDDIASAEVGDIKYEDGEFSTGEFTANADLSKFGSDKLGGEGSLSAKELKFKKGEKPTVGEMKLSLSAVTYNKKPLMSSLSVAIILKDQAQEKTENAAKTDKADLALDNDVDGKLSGLDVSIYLTESFKGVKLNAEKFSVTPKNFEFDFDKFSGEFGSNAGSRVSNAQLGKMTVQSNLENNKIAQAINVKSLEFTAEGASIKENVFSVGTISAHADTGLEFGGFKITGADIAAEFNDKTELKALKVGGTFGYKDYLSGSGGFIVDENGELRFDKVKDLSIKYGCFAGKLVGIEKEDKIVRFKDLILSKTTESDKEDAVDDKESGTIFAKFLKTVPDIEIGIKQLEFNDGVLKKPSLDDITLNKFKKDFTIGKALKGAVDYEGGDKGKFTFNLGGDFSLPKDGDNKKIKLISTDVPIIPPFLSANFELGVIAGMSAKVNLTATAQRSDKTLDINSELNAAGKANFGFYGRAGISASAIIAKINAGLQMKFVLDSDVVLDGKFGLSYDPNGESFFKSFKVNKEKTSLGFKLNGDLNFDVSAYTEVKGLPMIFSKKTLSHSWDLYHYKLMGMNIEGAVTYDPEEERYKFDGNPTFTYPGKLDYNPKFKQDQIDEFGSSLESLQNDMKKIDDLLQKANQGVDPSKGSLNEVEGDLGEKVQGAKTALMPEIKKRIDNVFQSGKENSLKCHALMVELTGMINDNADKMAENERNIQQIEKVMGQSKAALGIVGYDPSTDFTKEKYLEFIKGLQVLHEDTTRLTKLAQLEPEAIMNMFKAFKLDSAKSWEDVRKPAQKKKAKAAPDNNTEYQFKEKTYITGMQGLSELLDKRKKAVENQQKLVADAESALKNAKERKQLLETELDNKVAALQKKIKSIKDKCEADVKAEQDACEAAVKEKETAAEVHFKTAVSSAEKNRKTAIGKATSERDKKIEQATSNADEKLKKLEKELEKESQKEAAQKAASQKKTSWFGGLISSKPRDIPKEIQEVKSAKLKFIEKYENLYSSQVEDANTDYDKAVSTARKKSVTEDQENKAAIPKIRKNSDIKIANLKNNAESAVKEAEGDIVSVNNAYAKKITPAANNVSAAEQDLAGAKVQLDEFNKQMMATGDISKTMLAFQEYIEREYARTGRNLDASRDKYGLSQTDGDGKETPQEGAEAQQTKALSKDEIDDRIEYIKLIIRRLISDATEKNIENGLGKGENGNEKSLKRYSSRLKKINEESDIVDKNMEGNGLPGGSGSVKAFSSMKADSENFKQMKAQLDSVYEKLTGFHEVIRQSLQRWNEVNGINFKNTTTASDFSKDSGKVINLIKEVDDAEKNSMVDPKMAGISEEVKRLNGSGKSESDKTTVKSSAQKDELARLGIGKS